MAAWASIGIAQIPNGGFEAWEDAPLGDYQEPTGWVTLNGLSALVPGSPMSCEQGSPGAAGSYYATVTTVNITGFGLIPGVIYTGDEMTGTMGFAYSARPNTFSAQLQYAINPGDAGMVAAYFTKWNPTTQHSDSVGIAVVQLSGSAGAWVPYNVPVQYDLPVYPDTAHVVVVSSMNSPVAGSFVKVDDLGFDGVAAVAEQSASAVKLYPSPTTGPVQVTADRAIGRVSVVDLTGRTVMERNVGAARQVDLDMARLQTGRYLVQLQFVDGGRQVRTVVRQ